MSLPVALITGAVLVGALGLCAFALLSRHRRAVVGAEDQPGPGALLRLDRPELPAGPAGLRVAVEAAPPAAVSGLTKAEAERLLDWLEAHGYRACEVSYDELTRFTVRCR